MIDIPKRDARRARTSRDMKKARSEIDEYIGSRIRAYRLSLRLTQEQLAKALSVSFQQVQNYEKGANGISAVRLFDICKILNVPLASMFPPGDPKDSSRSVIRPQFDDGAERESTLWNADDGKRSLERASGP